MKGGVFMKTKKMVSFISALVWIISSFAVTGVNAAENDMLEEYDTEYGLHIKKPNYLNNIDGATEITDEETKELYHKIYELIPLSYGCPYCGAEETRIFAYENVKYDNATEEGKSKNSVLLNSQVAFLSCAPELFYIYLDDKEAATETYIPDEKDTEKILAYLNEEYKLRDYKISNRCNDIGMIHMSGFHYLTMELAETICTDLIEKGYYLSERPKRITRYVYGDYYPASYSLPMSYPEVLSSDIMNIISETGINAELVPNEDVDNCVTVNFTDVENITQMDVVNLRTKIYHETGLIGVAEYTDNTTGDVNFDGKVDVSDLSELSLMLIGDKKLTRLQEVLADVDQNGVVNLADLALLRQFLSRVVTSFK